MTPDFPLKLTAQPTAIAGWCGMASGGHIRAEEPESNRQFFCPEEMLPHLRKTLEGEYAVPWDKDIGCLVLDVGANCGAFTVWAKLAWPRCEIDAYEPNPEMAKYLKGNTRDLDGVTVFESAVGDPKLDKLYFGKFNQGESSQYQNGTEQTDDFIEIEVTEPESLLSYDIVKLDCEGAESYILARMDLSQTTFVMYEYHSEQHRRFCDEILCNNGFKLIYHNCTSVGYGVAKYQRFE
jgi:FkbM family methyltransferase